MAKNHASKSNNQAPLLKKIFTNRQVLIAMGSTLLLLIIFQFGAHITAPGLSIRQNSHGNSGSFVGLLNLLGGGGLNRVSLFAVGISPYITAQIIIQMLSTDIIKPLAELRKSGERGRKKLELYTRLLTFPFAIATAYGTLVLVSNIQLVDFVVNNQVINNLSEVPAGNQVLMIMMLIAGTYISLFISDIISKRGVGNGSTLIIMSGIISSIPSTFQSAFQFLNITAIGLGSEFIGYASFIIYVFFYILLLLVVVFINGAVRKIPVQQTGQGLTKNVNQLPFLPIKLIPAGVIPVIFAGSIMAIPQTIGQFIVNSDPAGSLFITEYLSLDKPVGISIYAFLIVIFSFFYSHIQVNAEQLTENFERSGRFIPGINAGQATYTHIKKIVSRVNWLGGPFLALIAVLPNILTIAANIPAAATIGGTGVVILVSGSIQLWDAIKSANTSISYRINNKLLQEQISSNYDLLLAEAMGMTKKDLTTEDLKEKAKEKEAKKSDDGKDDYYLW